MSEIGIMFWVVVMYSVGISFITMGLMYFTYTRPIESLKFKIARRRERKIWKQEKAASNDPVKLQEKSGMKTSRTLTGQRKTLQGRKK